MRSNDPKKASKWTCAQCGVSVSHIDGEPTPFPSTWDSSAEGLHCLGCRRERAADAGLESAAGDSPVAVRAQLRRTALIEFEVSRKPDHTDGAIAKACRTSVSTVAKARSRLQLPDPPTPSSGTRAKHRAPAGR